MLSNVLRVLLMKVTTRHMEKRSRKYLKLYENEVGTCYCARRALCFSLIYVEIRNKARRISLRNPNSIFDSAGAVPA